MKLSKEQFKRTFPRLVEELEANKKRVGITSVRSDVKIGEKVASGRRGPLSNYDPDVVAFIQRCNTPEEAEEIIDYLKRRGELTHESANRLKKQLHEKGLSSFGEKKEPGFYFRKYYRPLKRKKT